MTLVEVVVVIGIISIALPALFSTLIVSTRQQVSISRINEVKNQGDTVLGAMTSRIKNDAETLCMSTDGSTCGTKLCETADGPHDMNSFIDKTGGFVRYYADTTTQSLYEYSATASVVPVIATKRLTNDRVKVSSFLLQCQKTSATTRPIVSIQYSVLAEAVGNTKPEERATLDYSTKIAVDHIDTVALQVFTDGGSAQLTLIPIEASGPTITPRPTNTPTPIPATTVGDCTKPNTSRTGWTATADSTDPGEVASRTLAGNVLDGDRSTFWHTQWHSQYNGGVPPQPHRITINMSRSLAVECLKYLPRQYQPTTGTTDSNYQNGRIVSYAVYVSSSSAYTLSDRAALGTFTYSSTDIDAELLVPLIPKTGQYITLESSSALNSGLWSSAAEINLVESAPPISYYTVAGHVTNATSGAAISGVSLIVEYTPAGATSTRTATVVTDAAGYYSLSNTVPIDTQYSVRMQTLTGGSVGKSGYYDPHPTAPSQRAYDVGGVTAFHHTYRRSISTEAARDTQITDTSFERQLAGQNDCASAIPTWNYPAERCDFRLSTVVPPTLTPTPTPIPRYTYRQTFLSRDGATEYSRICDININTGISCPAFNQGTSITNLRGTGNERYSDWASTVYTLPNAAYDAPSGESTRALLPAGTQILITTLLATDGTSTFTRSCPLIIANSTSRCWPRSWAATTAAMYNLGTSNFGDGAGKSYVGVDFVAYPRVFNGQLRQAFRRWFVRSDEKTYIAQQCYIRATIENISDPISWGTECMNDSGTINAYSISDRTTDTSSNRSSGFYDFYTLHGGIPTQSSIVYPKGSGYELLQIGLNSEGDWTWNRNAVVDPSTTGSSGFIFASPAVLNNVIRLAATSIPINLRGVDGYVIKD